MTLEDAKLWADRKRTILSYIDQERKRILDLIVAPDRKFLVVDDREFLIYCIENSYTAAEVPRARELYDQMPDPIPFASVEDAKAYVEKAFDVEDLM
jgi:hypothetical protein